MSSIRPTARHELDAVVWFAREQLARVEAANRQRDVAAGCVERGVLWRRQDGTVSSKPGNAPGARNMAFRVTPYQQLFSWIDRHSLNE